MYGQVLANLVEFKLTDFEDIDSSIKNLDNKMIRELIMNLESKSSKKIFITIKWSWQGVGRTNPLGKAQIQGRGRNMFIIYGSIVNKNTWKEHHS